ncbi:uncharacterized protein LOC113472877 isoform X2 [Diaphorina citri]|uniref:Uncharacterized protein LOC113472877 isoform X1 n=1 Tax=Diaphorina citri TaxID=121845 RepID=A0A3Q0JNR8_DIACI|nr:uncharacterized protein LOC113472877 isoform X1 [Diaphorina citri]XP_026688461.1 uncharacterized protein LOC113472877 isoform X2 [Diaphorina citri]
MLRINESLIPSVAETLEIPSKNEEQVLPKTLAKNSYRFVPSNEDKNGTTGHNSGIGYPEEFAFRPSEVNAEQSDLIKDKVDIKLVDKDQLIRKKSESHSGGQKKSKNYSYHEFEMKSTSLEKKSKQRKVELHKQNTFPSLPENQTYDDSCKPVNFFVYNSSLAKINGLPSNLIKQEPWSTQLIKEEKLGDHNGLLEKLPMNLSMKMEQVELRDETIGPNPGDIPKNPGSLTNNEMKTSRIHSEKHIPSTKPTESSDALPKPSDKSCKDDLNGSENDLIREDPVCIYCYKKLPKDISNIIEHCRLCVYMLRPINIKYMCYMCLYNTHCRTGIKRHIMRHLNIRPYTCSICPFSGIVSRSLKLHMKTHSMEQLMNLSENEKKTAESGEFSDDFDNDQTTRSSTGEPNAVQNKTNETMRHKVNVVEAPVSFVSERLEPVLCVNNDAEFENVHNDSNNNVNNNTSLLYDKIETSGKVDAMDLTNTGHNNSFDSEISNKKAKSSSSSSYGNKMFKTFEELSLKGKSFTDCFMFVEQVESRAIDYCMKKST